MSNEQNEKTEEATPKRREKERIRGNISKSQDFTSSLILTIGLGLIFVLSSSMFDNLRGMLQQTLSSLNPKNISDNDIFSIIGPYYMAYVKIATPFFALIALAAIFIIRLQTGALFAKEALKPKFDKFTLSAMMKNLMKKLNFFSPKQMVELAKSIIKTIIISMAGFNVLSKRKDELFGLIGADPSTGFAVLSSVILELFATICVLLIIIGILDKKYQDYEYNKSIKMSKQEVKDELKNTEGDPQIKGKIKAFQMKIMQQKMMSKVKDADVVVVNPTHYAVALMYDPLKVPAPVVLAKGVDFVAFKIREIAKNNGIPIVENKPLARSLYKLVEVDETIPQELYVAVAEILQYVYTQKNK